MGARAQRMGPLGLGEARDLVNERLLTWIVTLSVVGYPLAGMLAVLLGLDSRATSIPFRLIVFGLSVWAMMTVLQKPQRIRFDLLLVVFLWLYLGRLIFDLGRPEFPNIQTDALFYVGSMLVPVMATSLLTRDWHERSIAWALFGVGTTVCVGITLMNAFGIGGDRILTETQQRLSIDTVNPITLGHAAVTTLFAILVLWNRVRNLATLAVLVLGGVAAFWVLFLANSRSPFVAMGLALLAWLFATRRWRILAGLVGASLVALVSGAVGRLLENTRFGSAGARSASERLLVQDAAWQDFLSSPLTGTGYLDSKFGVYPHNVVIESAMALGIVGLVLLTLILVLGLLRTNRAFGAGEVLLGCLFCQYLVLAQVSGNLYASGALFILLTVIGGRYLALMRERPIAPRHAMPWDRRHRA
ncbi:MAG: O-antigen ligase family protein [Alphaproteobacteria bacterium]|nr:O-antigen ligase family protein [Alphaproteobacteria bacterium]MBU2116307.1 O-antigen ligase family protein [Alphaproteobacteria bacterium]MBU2350883.1 O-antigen ligase family protein [Alphaproteobacteria bacterium]